MIKKLSWTQRALSLALAAALGVIGAHAVSARNASAESQNLPESKLVLKSARDVNIAASTAVIPIHRGVANGQTVWYIITDASDYGIAHDLNVLYAPSTANDVTGLPTNSEYRGTSILRPSITGSVPIWSTLWMRFCGSCT